METLTKCSERGCVFPEEDGKQLCRYHLSALEFDETLTDSAIDYDIHSEDGFFSKSPAKLSIVGILDGWYSKKEKQQDKSLIDKVRSIGNYRKYREAGICVECETAASEPSRTRCRYCLDKHLHRRKEQIELWKTLGLCHSCGARNDRNGKTTCNTCERKRARYRAKRASAAAQKGR